MKKFGAKKKTTTIASTIINNTSLFVFAIIIILSLASLVFQLQSTIGVMKTFMQNEAAIAAGRVSWAVKSYKNIVEGIGTVPELSMKNLPPELRSMLLKNKAIEYGLLYCKTLDLDGYGEDGIYRGDRDYFQMASNGKVVISDPLVARSTGAISLIVAAPVWRAGIYKGTVDSVVFASLDPKVLNDVLDNLKMSKHSDAYIIGYDGTTVAAMKDNLVLNRNNNILNALENPKYKAISDIEMQILGGDHKVRLVRRGLFYHCYASCPIEEAPDWTIIIECPINDYMQSFYISMLFVIALAVGAILVSIRQTLQISRRISVPVEKMADRLRKAAVGDFSSEVDFDDSLEEVKTISDATQILVNRMDEVINGNESYKTAFNFEEIINFGELEKWCELLQKRFNVSFMILDNRSQILLGDDETKVEKEFHASITVNDQKFGICKAGALPECKLEEEEILNITKTIASLLGNIAELNLHRSSEFESWRKNITFNTKTLVGKVEKTSKDFSEWLSELESSGAGWGDSKSAPFISKIRENIAILEESTEFARFTEFDTKLSEADYDTKTLLTDIEDKIVVETAGNGEFSFSEDESLPEKLFGDAISISRVATRLSVVMGMQNPTSPIAIKFAFEEATFGSILKINITVKNPKMSDAEMDRISLLMNQKELKVESLNAIEQKLIGVFRTVRMMNSKLSSEKSGDEFTIFLRIPQLAIKG